MASEVFQLYLLLTLKDYASGGLNSIEGKLRSGGKEARQYLQTFQQLRESMKRDLAVAGIGVGTLMLLKKGVAVAGDFEQAMADLRMSISKVGKDGTTDLQALGNDLARYETLGMQLGNRLPGSTQDFVKMFSVLKQGGLESKAILEGTGQAVAHLAVVTSTDPSALAEPFAQYAQQFQLTGEEATKLSDLLARLKFGTGLSPGELIEGSKFFQMRAGLSYGLTGLSGAEASGRLLGTLRTFGLEGGIGGRELGGFMMGLKFQTKEQQKVLSELRTKKGIELKLFDKGEFLGFENLFAQMAKLRTLNTEERIGFGEKLFSRENIGIANAMMQAGTEGWKKINDRIDQVAPLQDLLNTKTETYNAKLEAVQGTLSNLTATGFTPMLNQVKPLLDASNELVGYVQQLLAAHPMLATILGDIAGIGGGALVLTGVIKAGTTAWGLYRIARMAALGSVTQNTTVVAGFGREIESTAGKAGRLRQQIAGMGTLKMTVGIALVGAGLEMLTWLWQENKKREDELKQRREQGFGAYQDAMQNLQLFGPRYRGEEYERSLLEARGKVGKEKPGTPARRMAEVDLRIAQAKMEDERARRETFNRIAEEGWKEFSFGALRETGGIQHWLGLQNFPTPYLDPKRLAGLAPKDRSDLVTELRNLRGGALQDPNVLAKLLRMAQQGKLAGVEEHKKTTGDWDVKFGESLEAFKGLLKEAFGDETIKMAEAVAAQDLTDLSRESGNVAKSFADLSRLFGPANQFPLSLQRAGLAVDRFTFRLDMFQPPAATPSFTDSFGRPKMSSDKPFTFGGAKAGGGRVLLGTTYIGGERGAELFTPGQDGWVTPNNQLHSFSTLRETRAQPQFRPEVARAIVNESRGATTQNVTIHPPKIEIHIHGNADPERIQRVLVEKSREMIDVIEDELARRFTRHRERS